MHDVLKKAKNLIKTYETTDPFLICDYKDYIVQRIPMPKNLKGYTTEYKRVKIICINSNYSEESQRFTCFHELGHILLGHDGNIFFDKKYTLKVSSKEENEANLFATACMLSSYPHLKKLTIPELSDATGISGKYITTFLNFFNP